MTEVLGVDWYRRGWVGVVLRSARPPAVLAVPALEPLIARVPDAGCIGVDMPIGLPSIEREADVMARAYIGRRRSSVFMTPPREVLAAATYAEANVAATAVIGKKISQQAWALRHTIALVETVARADPRVVEVHPEVSFRAMAGVELEHPKTTWNGQAMRRECLAREGIVLPDRLDEGGDVPVADVLDAAAAAWSARRHALGEARSFPPGARPGQREVIWY